MKKNLKYVIVFLTVISFSIELCNASTSTVLKAFEASDASVEKPFKGTILLEDGASGAAKKRVILYRIELSSPDCHSTLEGQAAFFAKKDEFGDDSTFLRNGEVVKTSVFKGSGNGGDVEIALDVESKKPRYAGVSVDNAVVIARGCIKTKKFDMNFY